MKIHNSKCFRLVCVPVKETSKLQDTTRSPAKAFPCLEQLVLNNIFRRKTYKNPIWNLLNFPPGNTLESVEPCLSFPEICCGVSEI